jgi:hypothetical protein
MQVRFSSNARRVFTTSWSRSTRVWDSDTGRPVTEWLNANGPWGNVFFDPDSGRIIMGATNGIARVWEVPDAPMPVPEWLPKFAEAIAGIRLGERGNVELVPRRELEQMARRLPPEGAGDFYERLAGGFWPIR